MELTWTDRRFVHGCDISACFFDPDKVEREAEFSRRMLPVFKVARPVLLYSEQDRKNFVADPLIAQPDAVLKHGHGLISLEYKSQSRRSHRPEQWPRDIPCSGVLQTLAAAMAVAIESGQTVAPLLRCHNAIYFLRPAQELIARMMSSATEAKAYWSEPRYVSASQLAAYCEPWVKSRFGQKDEAQVTSSEAGRLRHGEMLRR